MSTGSHDSTSDFNRASMSRRRFIKATAGTMLLPALGTMGSSKAMAAAVKPPSPAPQKPESLVRVLYETLSDKQKKEICFDWDHMDKTRGLLRTRIENNWRITKPIIKSDFYNKEQQALIRSIFEGMTNPDWHKRFDQQLKDDVGGFGNKQSIAIFGTPPDPNVAASKTTPFEFVLASRHMTLRCDGDSSNHVAFGGPILYAHEGQALYEKPGHPGNVFWFQAQEATKLFNVLDSRHKEKALVVKGMPSEELVAFRGKGGEFQGVPIADLAADQKGELSRILNLMLDPFRKSDQDEALACLKTQGGLDQCHLAFYEEGDLGKDKIYDNWRIEGPSFVWYFRGKPHVHVWVNVADDPSVKLNAFQDSVM